MIPWKISVIFLLLILTIGAASASEDASEEITASSNNDSMKIANGDIDNIQEITQEDTTGEASHNYTETLEIPGDGCYDLTIYDAGGDGLIGGFYGLKAGSATLFSGGEFADLESNEFSYEVTADVEEDFAQTASVYPNPTSGLLNIVCEGQQTVTLYNMVGQRVFETVADGWIQVDMKAYGAGIYAIQIGNETTRIVVK